MAILWIATVKEMRCASSPTAPSLNACLRFSRNQVIEGLALAYDAHGNTTRLADETLAYDGQDRHVQTTLDDGSKVTYLRDATDRIVQRTEQAADGTKTITRYGFTGDGDTPEADPTPPAEPGREPAGLR